MHIFYALDKAPQGWTGGVGFVNKEMVQVGSPLVCGAAQSEALPAAAECCLQRSVPLPHAQLQDHLFPADIAAGAVGGHCQEHGEEEGGGGEGRGQGGGGEGADGKGGGTICLVCGPPPMVEKACVPALREAGFDERSIIVF